MDQKLEVAKNEEKSASKETFKAIKALNAKKKEKAKSVLDFDQGNLLKGVDNKLRFRSLLFT